MQQGKIIGAAITFLMLLAICSTSKGQDKRKPAAEYAELDDIVTKLNAKLGDGRVDRSEVSYTDRDAHLRILLINYTAQKTGERVPTLTQALDQCATIIRETRAMKLPWTRIWINAYGVDPKSNETDKTILSALWDRTRLTAMDERNWHNIDLKDLTVDGLGPGRELK